MKRFYPRTGTTEEWNAAYYRLEDYFRAHGVTNKVHQSQIILRLLERAAVQHGVHPEETPIKLALEEAYAMMDQWFGRLLPEVPAARASVVGRVGMLIMDAAGRWPNVFLADDPCIPVEFRTALRESTLRSGPDLRVSSMVPRALDVSPADEPVQETWEKLGRMSLAVLGGTLCVVVSAIIFYFVK